MRNLFEAQSIPMKYLDSLKEKQHIVLLYEDPEYARLLEFRFLKNGLVQGEECIYAMDEDSGSAVLRLLNYGIPLEDFKSKRIRVFQTKSVLADPDKLLDFYKLELSRLLSEVEPPFRIVTRVVPCVNSIIGMSVEIELERLGHENFEKYGGSIMCPYHISEIESTNRSEWLRRLRDEHHAVIYASKFDQGGVIYSC
jgi:hypothetical protein